MKFFKSAIMALAVIFALCGNVAEAGADIYWETTDVILERGRCIIKGYFYNNGDESGTVNKMEMTVDVKDSDNNRLWKCAGTFKKVKGGYVPAGGQTENIFSITDPDTTIYDGKVLWKISGQLWWK